MTLETVHPLPLDLREWALFIDIDGTLIDLAPTPSAIIIPKELPHQLAVVQRRAGGAMALVTGRAISAVDEMFHPNRLPVAGMHGAEMRDGAGTVTYKSVEPADLDPARLELDLLAKRWPGVILEDKGRALAIHYRQAPEAEPAIHNALGGILRGLGDSWKCQEGKMVVEIHPAAANKGDAVSTFMQSPPYLGRKPFVIGDDLTDETMFRIANDAGGRSVGVGNPPFDSIAQYRIGSADEVRDWIGRLAA